MIIENEKPKIINGIIYRALFPNGKSYIGQTIKTLVHRIKIHLKDAKHEKYKIQHAINKYGKESINWTILEEGIHDQLILDSFETLYIRKYNSFKNGYNETLGGRGVIGHTHTEEGKEYISLRTKEAMANLPNKEQIKINQLAAMETPEAKEKMSRGQKNRFSKESEIKKTSEATRRAMETTDLKQRLSLIKTLKFQNPLEREKTSLGLKKYYEKNPEAIKKNSDNQKLAWAERKQKSFLMYLNSQYEKQNINNPFLLFNDKINYNQLLQGGFYDRKI